MSIETRTSLNERTLRVVLAQLGEGIVIADRNGRFTFMNQVARSMMTEMHPLEAPLDARAASGERAAAREPLAIGGVVARALLLGETIRKEVVACTTTDGSRRWLTVSATPVLNGNGGVESAVVTFADSTACRERDALAPILESLARL